MSKKRHSHKRRIPAGNRAQTNPPPRPITMKNSAAQPVSPIEQATATRRMADLFKAVSAAPEGFLPWLDRLEIPYTIIQGEAFDTNLFHPPNWSSVEDWLVIRMTDLIEGEERNQDQGSVLDRLSRKRIEEKVAERYDGNNVQNS